MICSGRSKRGSLVANVRDHDHFLFYFIKKNMPKVSMVTREEEKKKKKDESSYI